MEKQFVFDGRPRRARAWLLLSYFVVVFTLYYVNPLVGLLVLCLLVSLLVWRDPLYLIPILPIVILLRDADLSGLGMSDGNVLAVPLLVVGLAALLRVSRLKHVIPVAILASLFFTILATNLIHLMGSGSDTFRIIRYSGFVALALLFVNYLFLRKDEVFAFDVLVPLVVVSFFVLAMTLYFSWNQFGWVYGGRLSIRLSTTSPRNTAFAVLLLILLLVWMVTLTGRLRLLAYGLVSALLILLLATGSRMALAALVIGLVLASSIRLVGWLLSSNHSVRAFNLMWTIFLLGIILSVFSVVAMVFTEWRVFQLPTSTATARLEIWSRWLQSLDVWQIALGIGVGNEAFFVGAHPHSAILAILFYNGFIAFFLLISFFLWMAREVLSSGSMLVLVIFITSLLSLFVGIQPDRIEMWYVAMLVPYLVVVSKRWRTGLEL